MLHHPSLSPPYPIQVGDPPVCGPGLTATWTLCSTIPMGRTNGTVHVALPTPVGVAWIDVLPWIAIPGEGASQVGAWGERRMGGGFMEGTAEGQRGPMHSSMCWAGAWMHHPDSSRHPPILTLIILSHTMIHTHTDPDRGSDLVVHSGDGGLHGRHLPRLCQQHGHHAHRRIRDRAVPDCHR